WASDPTRLKYSQAGVDPEQVMSTIPYEKGYAFLVRLERLVGRPAFDAFTRRYIAAHRFQTITTEAFITLMRRELPQIFDRVDVHAWLYEPGFPDDAPAFESALVDDVSARLFDYQEGRLPQRRTVAGWNTAQIYLFLQYLPRVIPLEDCRAIESAFALDRTRVPYFLSHFLEIAVRSGLREALPRAENLVATVGRLLITRPVFQAIAETDWSRPHARPLLERIRGRLHPITVAELERVAANAGA
ncbi:MAG TPA: leukotriene A4 hydrolase C-terminal domain-containing protein, partial [Anaerolineales bacterium]|nr:leukotriene A4 hydrolase C-terminal domain-containing protein [Anaerolineales bacterium]